MGVLGRFEKGIERAVNGAFAKAFRSEVQPVEVASALRRECDERSAVVGRDRYVAPNTYVVELGSADFDRVSDWEGTLAEELEAIIIEHAQVQRYTFIGPVTVNFEEAPDLDMGLFRVRSSKTQGDARPSAAARAPRGGGRPAPAGSRGARPAPAGVRGGRPEPGGHGGAAAPPRPAPAPVAPAYDDYYEDADYGQNAYYEEAPAAYEGGYDEGYGQEPAISLEIDGYSYPLESPVTVLGRSSECDIPLDDTGVSRRHIEIRLVPGGVQAVDLGSTNGSFVDGERISVKDLVDGSVVSVGRISIIVRFGQW